MKKRKHKVLVEITFDEPCTAKEAAWKVDELLDCSQNDLMSLVTTWTCKEFGRVITALRLKAEKVRLDPQQLRTLFTKEA